MATDEELHARVDWNMTNHAPVNQDVLDRFEAIRVPAKAFAHAIIDLVPDCRERSLALTELEVALMQAVAGIARNQPGDA